MSKRSTKTEPKGVHLMIGSTWLRGGDLAVLREFPSLEGRV